MSSAKAALESDTRVHTSLWDEILHMYNNASAVYNYFRSISYFRFLRTKQVEKAKSE